MWVEVEPRRLDFCGLPPCPLCYRWESGGVSLSGVAKFALDLLGESWDALSAAQRNDLEGVARRIHKDGIGAVSEPPSEQPPPEAADIGMSDAQQIDGWLRERRSAPPRTPRVLTCDEIADRTAAREAERKRKRKEREERLSEAKEVAKIFADASREDQERKRYEEQRFLREVDPRFVDLCRTRGVYDPREIMERYQQEMMMRPSFDPSRIDSPLRFPDRYK